MISKEKTFCFYLQVQEVYDEAGFWGFWKGVFPTLIMVSNLQVLNMVNGEYLIKLGLLLSGEQSFHAVHAL